MFIDPADPTATPIEWEGRWRTLEQAWTFAPETRQLHDGLEPAELPAAAAQHGRDRDPVSTIGAVLSSILVAYGFARFRFPGKNALFVVLIATIILPFQVTLLPHVRASSRGSAGTGRGCR